MPGSARQRLISAIAASRNRFTLQKRREFRVLDRRLLRLRRVRSHRHATPARESPMSPTSARPLAALSIVASAVLLACASTRITTGHAQALAVRDFCARPPADTSCTVQNVQRAGNGYIVTLDRRPPSGNDRVNVSVSSGGATQILPSRPPRPGAPGDTTARPDTTKRGP
jgi:hypothetical protein